MCLLKILMLKVLTHKDDSIRIWGLREMLNWEHSPHEEKEDHHTEQAPERPPGPFTMGGHSKEASAMNQKEGTMLAPCSSTSRLQNC